MVSNFLEYVKQIWRERKDDIFVALIILCVGLGGFGLGRLSILWPDTMPIRVERVVSPDGAPDNSPVGERSASAFTSQQKSSQPPKDTTLVGSKNGSVYHFAWCSGAQNIKEENKIVFASQEEAIRKGYTKAANCPGL